MLDQQRISAHSSWIGPAQVLGIVGNGKGHQVKSHGVTASPLVLHAVAAEGIHPHQQACRSHLVR